MKNLALIFLVSLSIISCTSGGNGSTGVSSGVSGTNTTDDNSDGIIAGDNTTDTVVDSIDGFDVITSSINVDASNGFGIEQVNIPFSNTNFLSLNLNLSTLNAFQVILQDPGNGIATVALFDPNNNEIVPNADEELTTFALIFGPEVNTLNYQTNDEDPGVFSGTYNQLAFIGDNTSGNVTATVIAKNDTSFSSGTVAVNLFLVGDAAQNSSLEIQQAMDQTRAIFSQISLLIDLSVFNVPSTTGVLPNPISGSNFFANQGFVSTSDPIALNVYVADFISSDSNTTGANTLESVFGVASSIPGPAILTDFSAVGVSLSEHQGPDGLLSNLELSILAETIAHESGHYLGLFHPVESEFDVFDPLGDTIQCDSLASCSSSGLISNLMFPFPIPGVPQNILTTDQSGVVHRNLLVN